MWKKEEEKICRGLKAYLSSPLSSLVADYLEARLLLTTTLRTVSEATLEAGLYHDRCCAFPRASHHLDASNFSRKHGDYDWRYDIRYTYSVRCTALCLGLYRVVFVRHTFVDGNGRSRSLLGTRGATTPESA